MGVEEIHGRYPTERACVRARMREREKERKRERKNIMDGRTHLKMNMTKVYTCTQACIVLLRLVNYLDEFRLHYLVFEHVCVWSG